MDAGVPTSFFETHGGILRSNQSERRNLPLHPTDYPTPKETSMRTMKGILPLFAGGALLVMASGCEKKEGPAEHAGKQLDQQMDKAGQQMEKAGERMQDAAEGHR